MVSSYKESNETNELVNKNGQKTGRQNRRPGPAARVWISKGRDNARQGTFYLDRERPARFYMARLHIVVMQGPRTGWVPSTSGDG